MDESVNRRICTLHVEWFSKFPFTTVIKSVIPPQLVKRIIGSLRTRVSWPFRHRYSPSSPASLSKESASPSPISSLLSQLDMEEVTLVPRPRNESGWSLFSWRPTSIEKAVEAEHRLLAQFLNIRFTGSEQPKAPLPLSLKSTSSSYFGCSKSSTAATVATEDHVPDPRLPNAELGQVQVGPGHFINTLILEQAWRREEQGSVQPIASSVGSFLFRTFHNLAFGAVKDAPVKNLVLTHGYGAGLGFFYKSYPTFSQIPGYRVFAIDWLGMANSSRPPFPTMSKQLTEAETVAATEAFFIDSLEEWRIKMGLEKIVLMGHSMGGYLSSAYALKYPDRVEKLLLVSPVGVPVQPPKEEVKPRTGIFFTLARNMWQMNITPMSIIRTFGPWGPSLVKTYTSRRFENMDSAEVSLIESYIYHISAQPGSGEFALARLLSPGAWAFSPLHNRLCGLKMPVTFIYGNVDWMDFRHAMVTAPTIPTNSRVSVIKDAGHHMYFDNPVGFDNSIIAELSNSPIGPYSVPEVEYVYLK
ncbi:hypothetical protein BDV3_000120 [Batrachochytrium dendrobatidis]